MQNYLAVYAPRGPMQSLKLVKIAADAGYAVRFVSFGVFVNPEKYRGRKASLEHDACLLCGWKEPGTKITTEFDSAADSGDRELLGKLLKKGDVSWVEFYTNKFNYTDQIKRFPRQQPGIDGSVAADDLPRLQAAKSRYLFQNKGRRKTSGEFMTEIATVLAEATGGVVANFVRPPR